MNNNYYGVPQNTYIPTMKGRGGKSKEEDVSKFVTLNCTPLEFKSNVMTSSVTVLEVCEMINALLLPATVGYNGCFVNRDNLTGEFVVTLYYKDVKGDESGKIKILKDFGTADSKTGNYERIAKYNNKIKSQKYELTRDAKELLSEFYAGKRTINRKFSTFETVDQVTYNRCINVAITGLSLQKFVEKIYGAKDAKGNKFETIVSPTNIIIPSNTYAGFQNYVIDIKRFNKNLIEELIRKCGLVPVNASAFPIIRADK